MQPKNKPLRRRKYDTTFKADVLNMIDNGQSVPYVAQVSGISEALIYKWEQGEEKHHSSEVLIENQRCVVLRQPAEGLIIHSDRGGQ